MSRFASFLFHCRRPRLIVDRFAENSDLTRILIPPVSKARAPDHKAPFTFYVIRLPIITIKHQLPQFKITNVFPHVPEPQEAKGLSNSKRYCGGITSQETSNFSEQHLQSLELKTPTVNA